MIVGVKVLGLEICVMLGMFSGEQVCVLKDVGLDYYNYNFDIVLDYYDLIIYMCQYQDCLDMLEYVCEVGLKICCGGIVGMGEMCVQCVGLLLVLVMLLVYFDLVLINRLVQVVGMLLYGSVELDLFEFVCMIVVVCIVMLCLMVWLLVGCEVMSDELQVLCFVVGVNLIFYGDKLLIIGNLESECDLVLFVWLGL